MTTLAPCGAHPITEDCCCLCHEAGRADERRRTVPLARRNRALENLLVCYRLGKRPSEKLFRELEATKADADALVADLLDGARHD